MAVGVPGGARSSRRHPFHVVLAALVVGALVVGSVQLVRRRWRRGRRRRGHVREFVGRLPHATGPSTATTDANSRFNPDERRSTGRTWRDLSIAWTKDGLVGVTGTPTVADGSPTSATGRARCGPSRPTTGADVWSAEIGGGFIVGAPAVDARRGLRLERPHPLPSRPRDRRRSSGRSRRTSTRWPRSRHRRSSSTAWCSRAPPAPRWSCPGTSTRSAARSARTTPRPARSAGASTRRRTTPTAGPASASGRPRRSTVERGVLYVGTGNAYVGADRTARRLDPRHRLRDRRARSGRRSSPILTSSAPATRRARTPTSARHPTCGPRTAVTSWARATRPASTTRSTATPARSCGSDGSPRAACSAARSARRPSSTASSIAVSNVGDPETNVTDQRHEGVRARSGDGQGALGAEEFPGRSSGPSARCRAWRSSARTPARSPALDTATGERLWTYQAPDMTGCGPSIVDGSVLWGYGFTLFEGPGEGGVISFEVAVTAGAGSAARRRRVRGRWCSAPRAVARRRTTVSGRRDGEPTASAGGATRRARPSAGCRGGAGEPGRHRPHDDLGRRRAEVPAPGARTATTAGPRSRSSSGSTR